MIMTTRRLVASDRYVREGKWKADGAFPLAYRASGRNVALLGMGSIGRCIAKRAAAMNNAIAYHSRHVAKDVPSSWRHESDLIALARWCDVLIIVVPSTPETTKIVNAAVLSALGKDGYLVNVARGSVVDEDALVAALKSGEIAGAGLDVYADEPNVPAALLSMDNVVLQPHVGSATFETRRAMSQLVLDNLEAHFAGKDLLTPVK
jgi:hydroxypyruvate reductase